MHVLLSVKPEFALGILSGSKKYEYRRTMFRSTAVESVFMYASSPMQALVGEFRVAHVLSDEPSKLWAKT